MAFQIFITGRTLRFLASSLKGKLAIYLVLAYLVELTLLTVIELWADSKRDVSVHRVPALIFAYKSIELVEEWLDSWIGAVFLVLHHRSVKRASGTALVPECACPFLDDLGLIPDTGRDDFFLDRRYFDGHRHLYRSRD